jgi:uncharacterized protein YjbI with pentapeptide repeats
MDTIMTNTHGLHVKKPVSVWNRPLKANFKDLFKSLTKTAISGATFNWVEAGKNASDALTAIGLEKDAGQIAWLLIYRSIEKALHNLVEENLDLIKSSSAGNGKAQEQSELSDEAAEIVASKLDLSVEQSELVIDESFFKKPGELSVLQQIKLPFAQWLSSVGLTEVQATSISDRLPIYFVYALSDEWRSRRDDYKLLTEALDTPFTKATELEQSWARYSAMLQKQIEEPMFYEAFSLRQVYIPLRAFYERKAEGVQGKAIAEGVTQKAARERVVIDLENELKAWLSKNDSQDAIRVISGGPGSGKSSFAKMFAAHQSTQTERRVLFVPLHRFEPTDDLIDAVKDFVSYDGFLSHNPLDPKEGESRLLIIFDGLDELSMQGKVAADVAQRFVQEVQRKVESFNAHEPRLKVLISGRELAVQSNVDGFRKPQQVLYILPYYVRESADKELTDRNEIIYIDNHKLLKQDQRQLWWAAYGKASGRGYDAMPEVLGREALVEITSQPLLNYLVALSYVRGALDFATESSLNVIYDDLLKAVYQRVWGEHQHPAVSGITEEQFFRILEEIAVAAWHGDGRTTTVREVETHCINSGLNPLLEKFKEGAKEGVARLLMAFYFRKSGNREATGDETFEFTHKSFGEYLAAKRIVRGVQRMHTELERRRQSYDGGWDERDALIHWAKLCGLVAMDQYLNAFVANEVRLQHQSGTSSDAERWQETLSSLIGFMLRHGTPMESLAPRPAFKEEVRQARNAEESLLAALNACAWITMKRSNIDWPSTEAFGEWLSRLQGQRVGSNNPLAFRCLSFLNLQDSILHIRDLYGADLSHTDLKLADLTFANLIKIRLEGANLSMANLTEANLGRANLSEAILEGANLSRANLEGAILTEANLEGANLSDANLEGANLIEAHLSDAILERANLEGAILTRANLEGAFLTKANLEGAHLSEAILTEANLTGAILERAHLTDAILEGANLTKANLTDAILERANLKRAILTGANISKVQRKLVNL